MSQFWGPLHFTKAVVLYQSKFFAEMFPEENRRFGNVEYVDAVPNDREGSLLRMRKVMLSRNDLVAAVFIGGMEGIFSEYDLFREFHPGAAILLVPAAGGAARQLAEHRGITSDRDLESVDFAELFHVQLRIAPDEPRTAT